MGSGFAYAQTPSGPEATPAELVDALNSVFGKHPGYRAVHAKGVVLEGKFIPSPTAAAITKAAHLQATSVPVTVRFSNFAGIPTLADNNGLASPHGLAIKFDLPDGTHTDIIAHSFNGFPSATVTDFRDLLVALAASGPDAAKPTALDAYLGKHPVAKAFLTAAKPAPESYATLPYYGVNTFKFTNAKGDVTYARYQLIPTAGSHSLTDAQAAAADGNYLYQEIIKRVIQKPAEFKLLAQIANDGDKIDDPSVAWPDSRTLVELGTLEISHAVSDSNAAQAKLLFMPNALLPGIEVGDSMLNPRSAAYPISYSHRTR
ncbi:catalase family peroxidase [Alcaligenaceae bacterium]|nr:catalase family peroxidase [Alcaligenaceae bacterium]